ncbi:putative bifunctional diguanylate cyclase/phosphodiesterase [Wenzhouxiangella marina]|uniref:Sensory box/GGDEF domain/EAL domain protein n=1 Tax=Wenzhouxiangella marina TaxID=1579979 RepID=A0A0K0XTU0_9GAMM|nr:EAL domain-containing protein [Wenzhouxiangella marina]AKS41098.1 Sensory box/GGDEF domain/EAL domain protein [Wenzhouxiangella marina]MBB6087977.1 diguanylate cyclase (GGDEF)-like protein/PAS domain S-box-containing protein [Wenzhouxiangella marina]
MPSASSIHPRSARNLDQVYVGLTKDQRIFASSLDESLKLIVTSCSESLDVARVSVWTFDQASGRLSCAVLYDRRSGAFERGAVLREQDIPRYFKALVGERLIDAEDACADPRTSELAEDYLRQLDIRSMLDATLRFEGQLRGVLCVESVGESREWSRSEKVFVSSLAELIDQMMILEQLRERESHYRSLFDHSADSIFIVSNGVFIDCNPAAETMYECTREQLLGAGPAAISPEQQPDGTPSRDLARRYVQSALTGKVQRFEWRHRTFSGKEFDSEVTLSRTPRGTDWCVMGIVRDISARKQAEIELEESKAALEYRALHDSLTGLPNRDSYHRDASARIEFDSPVAIHQAVYLLDLNRFKEVNDTLGHDFGDEMLIIVGHRLRRFADRHACKVYRLGGDEFVILANIGSEDEAIELTERLLEEFDRPFSGRDIDLHVDTSIGISLSPLHGTDGHALLRCADVALYRAKRKAAGYALFDPELDQKDKRHLTLMSDLVEAIERNGLSLHYHPRVDLSDDRCTHCEALLRWQHPEHGMIPPDEFIVSAELNNLIHQLTRWVLRTALAQLKVWLDQGIDMNISVNVSARNLVDHRFADDLNAMLLDHDVPASRLEIEITESALIVDPVRALESLEAMRAYGVSIAVDDFGTGYSSMSYLKRLPVHVLKIDKSFVQDLLRDESDATLVRSVIDLSHSFGLQAVAEGVEDAATLEALKAMNCDQAQGFHYCRPLPAADFEVWLRLRG